MRTAEIREALYRGTIFRNTNVPLLTWFEVIHLMLLIKKDINALQVHRMFGFGSYRTAWFMCHRVRAGLQAPNFRKLVGIVEVNETFVGGNNKKPTQEQAQAGHRRQREDPDRRRC